MNLNDIIRYLYISYFIRNVIIYSLSFLILIKLNISLRFSLINYLARRSRFFISFNKDSKYLFFLIKRFILL